MGINQALNLWMVFLKVFVRKKQLSNADKHFAMDFLCQAASINLSGVKDEPGRLPPSAGVAVCRPQSSPGAETERQKERRREKKKALWICWLVEKAEITTHVATC